MQIFLAYGYNERDQWIEEFVFPLIEAFGVEVVTGKVMYGDALTQEVKETIQGCDALLAFLTRRSAIDQGGWTTHPWVKDELMMASSLERPVVEVREEGVEAIQGFSARQQIIYREGERDKCLVQIAQAVGRVRARTAYTSLRLGPQELVDELRPFLHGSAYSCKYRLISANKESAYRMANIRRLAGNLYLIVQGVKNDDLIQIRVEFGEKVWCSDYERVDDIAINLRPK